MLNCLFCKKAKDFKKPERLLTSNTISLCFTCEGGELEGPYGKEDGPHSMIFWVNYLKISVDGGQEIPSSGCKYFIDNQK